MEEKQYQPMKTITYVKDTKAFVEEVKKKFPEQVDEDGNVTLIHTPLVKNENGSLAYSMLSAEQVEMGEQLETIVALGDYEEMFNNEEAHAIYKSVYPYDVPVTYIDEDGNEQEYYRPKKIGVFA